LQAYIAKRILLFIPTMLLVTIMVFLLMRLIPGDPALAFLLGDEGEGSYTEEQLAELRAQIGTDRPLIVQYGTWIWDMVRLDFGTSLYYLTPVGDDLKQKIPITIELAILAVLMAAVVAIPLGILSAVKQDTPIDYVARVISIGGVAMPTFWVAIMLIYFLVWRFEYLPIFSAFGFPQLWDDPLVNLEQLYLPAVVLAFNNMSIVARVTRSSMLEVFREDYIRTARSKGLRDFVVIGRHALKNALLPVVTISGLEFQQLIAGTIIIERIFAVPGMGSLMIDAIFHRDYTTVQSTVMVITFFVLTINLMVDLLYGWLDPRIRYA
jgi:peptide/nickel transport system permease protein